MKGLLKGLRYISQIFVEEKEEEIQIGLPTDVKHVAHIGSDGPSSTQPTWMSEFSSTAPNDATNSQPQGIINVTEETSDSPTKRKKHSRRRSSTEGGLSTDSPARDPATKPRRHKNSSGESPAREPSNQTQKNETTTAAAAANRAPKHRKKSKESSGPDKLPRPKDNPNPTTLDVVEE